MMIWDNTKGHEFKLKQAGSFEIWSPTLLNTCFFLIDNILTLKDSTLIFVISMMKLKMTLLCN